MLRKKLLLIVLLIVGCGERGCMDQIACNYDYSAESDDGHCIYPCETTSIDGVGYELKGNQEADYNYGKA